MPSSLRKPLPRAIVSSEPNISFNTSCNAARYLHHPAYSHMSCLAFHLTDSRSQNLVTSARREGFKKGPFIVRVASLSPAATIPLPVPSTARCPARRRRTRSYHALDSAFKDSTHQLRPASDISSAFLPCCVITIAAGKPYT